MAPRSARPTLLLAVLAHVHGFAAPPVPPPSFAVGNFNLTLDPQTQHVASLTAPASDLPSGVFDFLPNASTFHASHYLGDVTMRVRAAGSSQNFTLLTTGGALAAKAAPLPPKPDELAAANLTGTLATNLSLALERHYVRATHGVQMRFELTNKGRTAVEVGAWGAAMVLDTMAAKQRDLDGMAEREDVDVREESQLGRDLREGGDRREDFRKVRVPVERGLARVVVGVSRVERFRRENVVGEHDAFEPGLLADGGELHQVVGVGEGEGLPELHEGGLRSGDLEASQRPPALARTRSDGVS